MQIRCIGSIMMISMGSAEPMDFENIIKQMQEKETLELHLNTFETHGFKIPTQTLERHIFWK